METHDTAEGKSKSGKDNTKTNVQKDLTGDSSKQKNKEEPSNHLIASQIKEQASRDSKLDGQENEENQTKEDEEIEGAEEYRIPYYLENFELVMKTVLDDEFYQPLFNEDDHAIFDKFKQLSGKLYVHR